MQYFTLEEAAPIIGIDPGELKRMAERGDIRSFRDRGKLRFRSQDVEEFARRQGETVTEPDFTFEEAVPFEPPTAPFADVSAPSQAASPRPTTPSSVIKAPPSSGSGAPPDVFSFKLDESEEVDLGEGLLGGGSASDNRPQQPPSSKKIVPSPKPLPGSDSTVRLVTDGDGFEFHFDANEAALPKDKPKSSWKRPSQVGRPESKLDSNDALLGPSQVRRSESHLDSGVRLVPPEDLAETGPFRAPGSSSKLLEPASKLSGPGFQPGNPQGERLFGFDEPPPAAGDSTSSKVEPASAGFGFSEDVDLGLDLFAAGEASKSRPPQSKSGSKLERQPQPTAPFELSALHEPPVPRSASKVSKSAPLQPASMVNGLSTTHPGSKVGGFPPTPSSSKLGSPSSGNTLPSSRLGHSSDDELILVETHGSVLDSGINLQDLMQVGGGSQDQATNDDDFELSLDVGATPAPAKAESEDDFELNLDAGMAPEGSPASSSAVGDDFTPSLDAGMTPQPSPLAGEGLAGDNDFELSLDADLGPKPTSMISAPDAADSEFELSLEDTEGGGPVDQAGASGQERDIFDTDFDVPVIDEDADTALPSSDFDIDQDILQYSTGEEPSSSEVMVLSDDEELGGEPAAQFVAGDDQSSVGFGVVDDEEDRSAFEEEEEDTALARRRKPAEARWGLLPALFLLPCVLIMPLVSLMGYEMVRSAWGYETRKPVTTLVISWLSGILPNGNSNP